MSNFRERPRILVSGIGRYQERVSSDAHSRWMQAFFALPAVLASEVGCKGKTINERRLASDSLICPVPTTLPSGFSCAMFSVKMSRTTARSREVLTVVFLWVVTTPHHHCSAAYMAWDRMVCVGRVLTFLVGSGARGKSQQRSSRTSHCRCTGSWSRRSRHIPCQRKCRCSRLWRVASQRELQWSGQSDIMHSFRRTDGAPSHWRPAHGARQSSRVFLGAQQSWCSLHPWCKLQVRAGVLLGFRSANCEHGKDCIQENSVSLPQ